LRREFNMDIIATYPSVVYKVVTTSGEKMDIDNPVYLPEQNFITTISEPMVKAYIMCPNEYIGDLMNLAGEKRGIIQETETLDSGRVILIGRAKISG